YQVRRVCMALLLQQDSSGRRSVDRVAPQRVVTEAFNNTAAVGQKPLRISRNRRVGDPDDAGAVYRPHTSLTVIGDCGVQNLPSGAILASHEPSSTDDGAHAGDRCVINARTGRLTGGAADHLRTACLFAKARPLIV